jgi:hypothetical protein
MKRFILAAAVSCLCIFALAGTGRSDFTYDIYQGGGSGTLLAEFPVQDFVGNGTVLNNFTPTVLPAGVSSPGTLEGFENGFPEATIAYAGNHSLGQIEAALTTSQFPTNPGTYALDTSFSWVINPQGQLLGTPDTLVISTAPSPATPEPSTLSRHPRAVHSDPPGRRRARPARLRLREAEVKKWP